MGVPGHNWLVLILWTCVEAAHDQGDEKREIHDPPLRHSTNDLPFHLTVIPISCRQCCPGAKPLKTMCLWRKFQIQTTADTNTSSRRCTSPRWSALGDWVTLTGQMLECQPHPEAHTGLRDIWRNWRMIHSPSSLALILNCEFISTKQLSGVSDLWLCGIQGQSRVGKERHSLSSWNPSSSAAGCLPFHAPKDWPPSNLRSIQCNQVMYATARR